MDQKVHSTSANEISHDITCPKWLAAVVFVVGTIISIALYHAVTVSVTSQSGPAVAWVVFTLSMALGLLGAVFIEMGRRRSAEIEKLIHQLSNEVEQCHTVEMELRSKLKELSEREELHRMLTEVSVSKGESRRVSELASGFSNVLCAISASNELARLNLSSAHPANLRLNEIDASCQRAFDLVRQLSEGDRQQQIGRDTIQSDFEGVEIKPFPKGTGQRILIVDDEIAALPTATRLFKRLGYNASFCKNATEALPLLLDSVYDCVITDLTRAGLRSIELIAQCQRSFPEIPVVLTGETSARFNPEDLRSQGIEDLIEKPISAQALAETLERVFTSPERQSWQEK